VPHAGIGKALYAFARDILEVGRAAADDRPDGDNRVKSALCSEALDDKRHLERTGNAHDGQIPILGAVALQGIQSPSQEALHHEAVEAPNHKAEAGIGCAQRALQGLYRHEARTPPADAGMPAGWGSRSLYSRGDRGPNTPIANGEQLGRGNPRGTLRRSGEPADHLPSKITTLRPPAR